MPQSQIEELIKKLQLVPLPDEGGLFAESYRSDLIINKDNLPAGFSGERNINTAIYYMLTGSPVRVSKMHQLISDEVYHFYLGDPVEMLLLYPNGNSKKVILGQNILEDNHVQFVVPKGVWQGSHLLPGGTYALLGTTVSPGFNFDDTVIGNKKDLIDKYPDQSELISRLT